MQDELADLRRLTLPFDVDDVDPQCIKCVRDQMEKYKNYIDPQTGEKGGGKFFVPCTGIPKHPIDPVLKNAFDPEVWSELEAISDVTKWAKKYIKDPDNNNEPWIARWYQEEVLRCTSRRKVLRISRRTGKTASVCIDILYSMYTNENIKLIVAAPQKVQAEEIITRVRAYIAGNPDLQKMVVRDVSAPFYEIKLSNGSRLRGFSIGTKDKVDAIGIRGQDGDKIYCFPKGTLVSTSKFSTKPIERLTLQDSILGGNQDGVFTGDIKQLGVRKGTLVTIPTAIGIIKCTPDHPLFDGERDVEAKDAKEVITSLYYQELTFGYENIKARLLGMLYGDGWISNGQVGFSGQPEDLEQVQTDLSLLGDKEHVVSARITENKEMGIKGFGAQLSSTYAYHFFKDLHPSGRKVLQPIRVPEWIMNHTFYIKTSFLSGLFSAESTGVKYQLNERTPRTFELNMRSLKEEWISAWFTDVTKLLDEFEIKYSFHIEKLEHEEEGKERYIGYLSIANAKSNIDRFIDKIGFCYNAEKTRTANEWRLFRHYEEAWNSDRWTKNRLVRSFNLSSSKISDKTNIPLSTVKYHKNLYNELFSEDLLKPKEYIEKITWKDGYVKLPIIKENVRYSTELVDVYNLTSGAANRFFAGGMFTHNCEEMDYASDTAIQGSVFPILQTNPNTHLIGFSTPSGFKTPYYHLCKENPYYKEFFYNYKVLPWWKNVEAERSGYTEDEWSREFLAEFGETEAGVYKPSYIDRCLRGYQYKENHRMDTWRYTIGTDWNEKKGAEIVVLGHNKLTGKFQVVEAVGVGKSEFTQLAGVSKLLELNRKWKPSFVYIDAGNGSSNHELLLKTAQKARNTDDRATAKLLTTLKKYDSGASINIKDPITGLPRKSQAKAFMVNASIRMFEQGHIILSSDDKVLENQLRSYIIDRISPTGVPVYKAMDEKVGDHRLDALNLAIVAFHLEFDDLYKQATVTTMLAAPDPRTGTKQVSNRSYETQKANQPDERRLENIDTLQYARMSGRTDNNIRNTNRPGWDTDEEDKKYQEHLQRRRSNQSRLNRNRPQRNSF